MLLGQCFGQLNRGSKAFGAVCEDVVVAGCHHRLFVCLAVHVSSPCQHLNTAITDILAHEQYASGQCRREGPCTVEEKA